MTLPTTLATIQYVGTGLTQDYDIPFKFFRDAQIVAKKISSTGTETPLTFGPDFTLNGAGTNTTGVLHLTAGPLGVGEILEISRSVALTQLRSFINLGAFSPEIHEAALDEVYMILQWLDSRLSVAGAPPSVYTSESLFPAASSSQAGRLIRVKAAGAPGITYICEQDSNNAWGWYPLISGAN